MRESGQKALAEASARQRKLLGGLLQTLDDELGAM